MFQIKSCANEILSVRVVGPSLLVGAASHAAVEPGLLLILQKHHTAGLPTPLLMPKFINAKVYEKSSFCELTSMFQIKFCGNKILSFRP
jgi:hypothetical protein